MTSLRTPALSFVIGILLAGPASAHDLGTTQVAVTLTREGTYQIDVTVDPDALLARLDGLSGRAPRTLAPEDRDRRLSALAPAFTEQAIVRFDRRRAAPAVAYLSPKQSGASIQWAGGTLPVGTMRLTGAVPRGARTFTWAYGLVYGSYPLTINRGEQAVTLWIAGAHENDPVDIAAHAAQASRASVALQYLQLGFTHIFPKGLDHILFVLGIFLLSTRLRPVLLQVTTFTIAHSITLGLTLYGVLSLPSAVVEPLIAVSIAYVAIENLFTSELKPWRIALVFGFGLLHGMGFAGILRELSLPRSEFFRALVTFNAGVEAGQLAVLSLAFLLVACWWRRESWYRRRVVVPASLVIALTGMSWTIQRIAG